MKYKAYSAHSGFVLTARKSSALPYLVMGLIAIELFYGMSLTLFSWAITAISTDLATAMIWGNTPGGLLLQLFSFLILLFWIVLIAHRQHDRGFFSLIGPPLTAIRQFRTVLAILALLLLVIEIMPPWWSPDGLAETRNILLWAALLPVSLLALTIQTGVEEVLYRGYVQQQIAARFDNPLIWLALPNILFALAHWDNGVGPTDSARYVIWAFFFGLAASDLTARCGNLGPAIAFHLANNAYAFLIYGQQDGPDSGLALFLFEPDVFAASADVYAPQIITFQLILELALVAVMWIGARLAIKR